MDNLKEVLFFRMIAESDDSIMKSGFTEEEKIRQEERATAIYQVIEEAGLKDEFRVWKKEHQDDWRDL